MTLRFPGQQFDSDTNLHYNQQRDYNPATGRYVQADPIGLGGGVNLYGYVGAAPTLAIDSNGLATYSCKSPLHALGGTGARSGPDVFGNLAYQQFLCVRTAAGETVCGGQDTTGSAVISPGRPTAGDTFDAARCELINEQSCVDHCVTSRVTSTERPTYALVGGGWRSNMMNCQQWADGVTYDCARLCLGQK